MRTTRVARRRPAAEKSATLRHEHVGHVCDACAALQAAARPSAPRRQGRPEKPLVVDFEPLMDTQTLLFDLERDFQAIPSTIRFRISGVRSRLRDSIARRERVA